jgi:hypothetical protein
MHRHSFLNRTEVYHFLFYFRKNILINKGFTEDKSSRLANIYAIQNCWKLFNKSL